MTSAAFTIERTYNAPVETVWQAITNPDAIKQWFFDLPDFKAEAGCEFRFYGGKDENHQYLHICQVTEVLPGTKLVYSWRYDGYAGISYVIFELSAAGGQTRLKFTHKGIDSFPADNADFAVENFAEGWTYTVDALKGFVEQ